VKGEVLILESIAKELRVNKFRHNIEVIGDHITVSYSNYPTHADEYHVADKAWRDFKEMLAELKSYDIKASSDGCIFPAVRKPGWKISGKKVNCV